MTGLAFRLSLLLLAGGSAAAQEAPDWSVLGPFFDERCVGCHSGSDAPLGLQLDSYEGAMRGSRDGPVLVPGDVEGSELVRRVKGLSQPQMPLGGPPLTGEEIALIESWVLAGLPEGGGAAAGDAAAAPGEEGAAAGEEPGESEAATPAPPEPPMPGPDEPVTFAHVEPIFLGRCAGCHTEAREGGPPEGLRLDSLQNILAGGERLVLVPGHPEASEIVRRIEGTAQPRMPLNGPPWLSEEQIALIRRWIAEGAPDAAGTPAPMPVGGEVRFRGVMTGPEEIDGVGFRVTPSTRIDDRPGPGQEAEVRGLVTEDGGIEATRWRDR